MSPMLPPFAAALGGFSSVALAMVAVWTLLSSREKAATSAPVVIEAPELLGVTRALASIAVPLHTKERDAVARQLVQAGFDDRIVMPIWFAIRGACTLIPVAVVWLFVRQQPTMVVLGALGFALGAGYVAPAAALRFATHERQRKLRRAVPTLLDMLVTTLGSGLPFEAALDHIAEEISFTSPPMAKEILDLRARVATGMARPLALQELARRIPFEEIDALVSLLGQSERYGVGVASALRGHAEAARKRRLLGAEQRATKLAGTLTVVMVVVVLPAVLVVLVGPILAEVASALVGVEGAP